MIKNEHQAVSQSVWRFGKRSPPEADEYLQWPHNTGSWRKARFFNTLVRINADYGASPMIILGEIDYQYPVIAALELYLWKEPHTPHAYPYPYPFGYPYYRRGWLYPGYPY